MQFCFDDHALDVARRELRRSGELVDLEPQVFDLLVHLIRNRDRVVSKDDLLNSVWGGRIVSEFTMTSRLNAARKAVGDSGEAQRLIRTVPRRGFRFVGKVIDAPREEPPSPEMVSNRASIAVLPFDNLTGDREDEYFVDGMVEEIITGLSRIRWLLVISRNSTFIYKGKPADVRMIGRELGVRYVLEGSVRRSGSRVRVTGQLIETETGAHIWANRYDSMLGDIFALQDEMTMSVIGAVEPTLRKAEVERVRRSLPTTWMPTNCSCGRCPWREPLCLKTPIGRSPISREQFGSNQTMPQRTASSLGVTSSAICARDCMSRRARQDCVMHGWQFTMPATMLWRLRWAALSLVCWNATTRPLWRPWTAPWSSARHLPLPSGSARSSAHG